NTMFLVPCVQRFGLHVVFMGVGGAVDQQIDDVVFVVGQLGQDIFGDATLVAIDDERTTRVGPLENNDFAFKIRQGVFGAVLVDRLAVGGLFAGFDGEACGSDHGHGDQRQGKFHFHWSSHSCGVWDWWKTLWWFMLQGVAKFVTGNRTTL